MHDTHCLNDTGSVVRRFKNTTKENSAHSIIRRYGMLTALILRSRIIIYTNMNGVKFAAGGSGQGGWQRSPGTLSTGCGESHGEADRAHSGVS